jgi:hypothetical protein
LAPKSGFWAKYYQGSDFMARLAERIETSKSALSALNEALELPFNKIVQDATIQAGKKLIHDSGTAPSRPLQVQIIAKHFI